MKVLEILEQRRRIGKKSIAVLIDPDKAEDVIRLKHLVHLANENCVDFFFVGGSLITMPNLAEVIQVIKEDVNIPVVLFPGSAMQIDPSADAILFLSLISGRNPDLLIGQHVQAAPILKNNHMEVMPTGYMLISSGRTTSVAYISNTTPIPEDKYSLAACTALAGEMLGLKLIYLDAGSGAERGIDLVGITLEIFGPNPTADNPQSGVETILGVGNAVGRGNPLGGVNELVDPSATDATAYAKNGKTVPEGWLVNPHGSISGDHLITQSVVESIVSQSIAQANKTRAAIRLTLDAQPGVPTKMVIAVADKDGNVLGLYRMHDATVFSIDVAVAKARNTAYYTDPTKLQPQDKIDDDLLVARGDLTPSQIASYGVTLNGLGTPDLYQNSASTQPFSTAGGYAASNRTFRFLAEPRYPSGVDDTLPPIFSILNDHNSDLNTGTNPLNAENLGAPAPVSQFQSVLGYSAFHPGANFRDPLRVDLQNGIVFFPGSTPLFTSTALAGGFGISGDGVDQDDVVTFAGAQGYSAPIAIQADQAFYRGVRLPFQKFNRNPQGLS